MGRFKGWIYCFLWYTSILAGYALFFCPAIPLLYFSSKLFRMYTDLVFTYWQMYPTVLLQVICKTDIQVSGDAIKSGETSILIMNHRTRTDWNFFWPAIYHSVTGPKRLFHPVKFVLKDVIRHIPGPGWAMQTACFLFIKRYWAEDKCKIQNIIEYFSRLSYKFSLLLFPEGTDLTEHTKEMSHKYSEAYNLEKYEYVLQPRTTGFIYLARKLMEANLLDAVYDITLIYCDTVPQSEKHLIRGQFPKVVKMHFVRYPKEILPRSDEGLKEFLEKRWLEKERTIKEFYATGNFLHGSILKRNSPLELYSVLVFWTLLPLFVGYLLFMSTIFSVLVFVHTVFVLFINFYGDGFPEFEMKVDCLKRRIFNKSF